MSHHSFVDSDYIKLNIGGRKFLTSYSTLTKYESMLKTMIIGNVPLSMDSDGSILIDRDGTYFNLILNFMRDGEVDLPDDDHALQLIKREVEFYSFEDFLNYMPSTITSNEKLPVQIKSLDEMSKAIGREKVLIAIEYDKAIGIRDFLISFNIELRDFMRNTYPTVPIYHVPRKSINETHRPILYVYYYQKAVFIEGISHTLKSIFETTPVTQAAIKFKKILDRAVNS